MLSKVEIECARKVLSLQGFNIDEHVLEHISSVFDIVKKKKENTNLMDVAKSQADFEKNKELVLKDIDETMSFMRTNLSPRTFNLVKQYSQIFTGSNKVSKEKLLRLQLDDFKMMRGVGDRAYKEVSSLISKIKKSQQC